MKLNKRELEYMRHDVSSIKSLNFGQVENGVRGIQQGICDSTSGMRAPIMSAIYIYIVCLDCTIRQCAEKMHMPKSTVHYYIHKYIKQERRQDYNRIVAHLEYNKKIGVNLGSIRNKLHSDHLY